MKVLKNIIFLGVLVFTIIQLSACAPGAHVRVGVGVHTPGPWIGPYPYPPPPGPVRVGRPAAGQYYPVLETNFLYKLSTREINNVKPVQNK